MCQGDGVEQPPEEASMGQASTIGLDIAKWVFQAHGADATGRVVFRKRLVRAKVLEFFAGQPPCLVALEACGGGAHWARELGKLGEPPRVSRRPFCLSPTRRYGSSQAGHSRRPRPQREGCSRSARGDGGCLTSRPLSEGQNPRRSAA